MIRCLRWGVKCRGLLGTLLQPRIATAAAAASAATLWYCGASPSPAFARCDAATTARDHAAAALASGVSLKEGCGAITLKDGRQLAYHIEGDTAGAPIMAFHGMGSSHLTWVSDISLSEIVRGVCLISIDRPGYGESSSPPAGYSYSQFVADIKELADSLQLDTFCVAGHSSGGPYALAAAALLPGQVVACAAVSSDPPYAHLSAAAAGVTDGMADDVYGVDLLGWVAAMRRQSLAKNDAKKAYAWKQGELGFVTDFVLERTPWAFKLEDIKLGDRVVFWVGEKDFDSIRTGAPFMRQLVPGSKEVIVPRGNHGFKSEPEHLARILGELRTHWKVGAR